MLRSLTVFILLLALGAFAQSRRQNPFPPDPTRPDETRPADPAEARMERDRVKKMNEQRQDQIKHDTDELLKLATELKQQVDKTNEHLLSLDVVKKAEQIEKLAKSVKDKMKAEYP